MLERDAFRELLQLTVPDSLGELSVEGVQIPDRRHEGLDGGRSVLGQEHVRTGRVLVQGCGNASNKTTLNFKFKI